MAGSSARCAKHRRAEARAYDARRGSSTARGYGYRWQRSATAFLEAHPLCATHEKRGELVPAEVVDHIVPHRGDMALFWRRSNWQPLCKRCHDIKTATEDGGFGNRRGRGPEKFKPLPT